MHRFPGKYLVAFFGLLVSLSSCGDINTIVTVYPDGSATLQYEIEAPTAARSAWQDISEGRFSSLLANDTSWRAKSGKLLDSLFTSRLDPYLKSNLDAGRIAGYRLYDSIRSYEFLKIARIDFRSYADVGPFQSRMRQELPLIDSFYSQLANDPKARLKDSIAIVERGGDSLEFQIHHFAVVPTSKDGSSRFNRTERFFDSLTTLFVGSDTSESRRQFAEDTVSAIRRRMSSGRMDSLGIALESMNIVQERLVSPTITFIAPILLYNNESKFPPDAFEVRVHKNAAEFKSGYSVMVPEKVEEPIRQGFRLRYPTLKPVDAKDRKDWREILLWCDECEAQFKTSTNKNPNTAGITFMSLPDSSVLIEVSCGNFEKMPVAMYAILDTQSLIRENQMESIFQYTPLNDPTSRFLDGDTTFLSKHTNVIIGKTSFEQKSGRLTIRAGSTVETYNYVGEDMWKGFRWQEATYPIGKGRLKKFDRSPVTSASASLDCTYGRRIRFVDSTPPPPSSSPEPESNQSDFSPPPPPPPRY